MSGAQDHAGRLARLECFLPTRSTEAPTVAGFQAAKTEFRHRCRKIVAAGFGKLEKRGGHDGADRVATDILSPSVAAAVSKEPRHWAYRADFEPLTEHVTGCARPTASITVVDRLLIFGESHLPLPTRADIVAKVENRTTLKISRKLIFGLLCCCVAFQRGYEGPWSISDGSIWSLTSPRVKRNSGSKKFRSSPQKDFCNTIGQKLTSTVCPLLADRSAGRMLSPAGHHDPPGHLSHATLRRSLREGQHL